MHADLGDQVRFVGINTFAPIGHRGVRSPRRGVHYELLYDPDGAFDRRRSASHAYPVTLFVAADGTIVRQTGVLEQRGSKR